MLSPVSSMFIMEYISRMRLRQLGFVDSLDDLDCVTAEALLVIDAAVEEIKGEEAKKMVKR